jgi:hypothetical protein
LISDTPVPFTSVNYARTVQAFNDPSLFAQFFS